MHKDKVPTGSAFLWEPGNLEKAYFMLHDTNNMVSENYKIEHPEDTLTKSASHLELPFIIDHAAIMIVPTRERGINAQAEADYTHSESINAKISDVGKMILHNHATVHRLSIKNGGIMALNRATMVDARYGIYIDNGIIEVYQSPLTPKEVENMESGDGSFCSVTPAILLGKATANNLTVRYKMNGDDSFYNEKTMIN